MAPSHDGTIEPWHHWPHPRCRVNLNIALMPHSQPATPVVAARPGASAPTPARLAPHTVLITGAAGFIGSHLAEALLSQGCRVVGLDNLDPFYDPARKRANLHAIEHTAAQHPPGGFTFVKGDLLDTAALTTLLQAHSVQSIVHLAARAGVRPSIDNPVLWAQVNVVGTQSVLTAATNAGVQRVVCASSSSVYGNCPVAPFHEDLDVSQPISPYAATKRACELIGFTHWHLHRLPVAMLRFFTVYGERQRPDLAISLFLDKVSRGLPIPVYGDTATSRDYTYVADTVAGIISAVANIDNFGYRVWNLGNDLPVSLGDMIAAIGKVVGKAPVLERLPARQGDVERTWADLKRSRAELGYSPAVPFAQGLEHQWAWQQQLEQQPQAR